MRPLSALERFLERLFERPGARLFDTGVAPATLARRIERAIDEERRTGAEGPIAPTRFEVRVERRAASELARLPELEGDLAAAALAHARRRGYLIPERPSVAIVAASDLPRGAAAIRATFAAPDAWSSPPAAPLDRTRVQHAAAGAPSGALLRVLAPDGTERRLRVEGRPFSIGRDPDNDLVIADRLLSRHHARLVPRNGRLVLGDLGSRNGTRVNGRAIREAVLGAGDRVELGATIVDVLPLEDPWIP